MATPFHPPVKRSIEVAGHKTSITLEPLFWDLLKDAATREGIPLNALVARIDAERIEASDPPGLAGAVRLWLAASLAASHAEMQNAGTGASPADTPLPLTDRPAGG